MNNETYLTVDEVSQYIGLSVGTIYNKVSSGDIPFHKFGAKIIRFKKDEIDEWLSSQESKMRQQKASVPEFKIPTDIIQILKENPVAAPAFLRKKFGQ
ncbi:MAG: helix-turn-helix domain-containing protein [Fibrobacteres bacterium]|nr:helix-turn-helix domain-containing protein [Fibrobacterota bacterium]